MLSSILPGVRQSHAELASGALWLYSVWIAFGSDLNDAVEDSSSKSIDLLVSQINGLTGLAVVAVASYLVGTMWNAVVEVARYRIWNTYIRRNPVPKTDPKPEKSSYYFRDLWRPYSYRSHRRLLLMLRNLVELESNDDKIFRRWATEVMHESLYVGRAILTSDRGSAHEVYGEYTRSKAEGELRDATVIPLFVASSTTIWNLALSPFVALLGTISAATVSIALFLMARRSTRNANSQVLHWISQGHITTASIDAARDGQGLHGAALYLESQWAETAHQETDAIHELASED